MSLIMMLVVLVLFIILLLLSIISKKKILLYITVCLAVIIGLSYILMNTVFYYNSDSVSVTKNEKESFKIKVENHRIKYAGSEVKFSCKYSKQELYDKISRQYDNIFFDEKFDQRVIIEDNEIYIIKEHNGSAFLWNKKYVYTLFRSYVSLDLDISEPETKSVEIPFPAMALVSNRGGIEENVKIKCDFAHLKQYYENFTNVNIGDNTIEIMLEKYKCIITVNGDEAHFEIVEM